MEDFTPFNIFDEADKAADNKEEISCVEETILGETEEEKAEAGENDSETVLEIVRSEEIIGDNPIETEEVAEDIISEKIDKVLESQQQLSQQIELLNSMFSVRIMHTEHEEKIIDQMHKELQKYKEDMYAQLVRPILLDVIEVRDSIMRMADVYLSKPEGEQNIPNKTFSDYAFDLQDILERNSVEIYRSKSGEDFTPIKQSVIRKVVTYDEALHGKVAESLSCGYSYNGRTISAEKITVYYYEKPVE